MFSNEIHQRAYEAMKAERLDEAVSLFTQALAITPNDPDILADRGVTYLHLNNKEASFADFNSALAIQPNYAFRYASRGYAKNFFGDIDGAIEDYEKAVELDPEDAVAHNNLGLLLEQKGYKNQAEKRFEQADKLSKMENELYSVMDELEKRDHENNQANNERTEQQTPIEETPDITLIDPIEVRRNTMGQELGKVFTNKSQFKEFLRFIKNGFKLK